MGDFEVGSQKRHAVQKCVHKGNRQGQISSMRCGNGGHWCGFIKYLVAEVKKSCLMQKEEFHCKLRKKETGGGPRPFDISAFDERIATILSGALGGRE